MKTTKTKPEAGRPVSELIGEADQAKDLRADPDVKLDIQDSEDSQDNQDSHGQPGRPASPAARSAAESISPFEQCIEDALAAEMEHDHSEEGWRSQLWNFTRVIKSWCKVGTDLEQAFAASERAIQKRYGGWTAAFDAYWGTPLTDYCIDDDTVYTLFSAAWQKIRYREDETPLDQALAKARAFPLRWDTPPGQRKSRRYDEFASLAIWLQFTMGDSDILLPVQMVAQRLGTDQRIVSLWRQRAEADGLLVKVKEHSFKVGGRGQATLFRVPEQFVAQARNYAKNNA